VCPAAQLSQEEIDAIVEHKDKLELRRSDVESQIEKMTPKQRSDREVIKIFVANHFSDAFEAHTFGTESFGFDKKNRRKSEGT
jgi:hypothetical protein